MSGAVWPTGRARDGGVDDIALVGALADGDGRMWLCGKHAIGPDVEALLARLGATRVVCLTERHELLDRYPEYVAWLDRERGERARWHPVHDLSAPTLAEFADVVALVMGDLAAGERIVVHCAAGIGRAGTLAVGLLLACGSSLDDAIAHVAGHRPMAGPEVGAQQSLVEAFAARCGADGSAGGRSV